MKKALRSIMLIDDSPEDNFFHERAIRKVNADSIVVTKNSGIEALEYIKSANSPHSDLIFLDINMPGMNGWEFLEQYSSLSADQKSDAVIIMLTTSDSWEDADKAKMLGSVTDFITKPLTKSKMDSICEKYFTSPCPVV